VVYTGGCLNYLGFAVPCARRKRQIAEDQSYYKPGSSGVSAFQLQQQYDDNNNYWQTQAALQNAQVVGQGGYPVAIASSYDTNGKPLTGAYNPYTNKHNDYSPAWTQYAAQ